MHDSLGYCARPLVFQCQVAKKQQYLSLSLAPSAAEWRTGQPKLADTQICEWKDRGRRVLHWPDMAGVAGKVRFQFSERVTKIQQQSIKLWLSTNTSGHNQPIRRS
jgi:hypothetical protein